MCSGLIQWLPTLEIIPLEETHVMAHDHIKMLFLVCDVRLLRQMALDYRTTYNVN